MKKHFPVLITLLLFALSCTSLFSMVQVGTPVAEKFETPHPYPYNGQNGVVFEKVLHHPNAGYISIHFSKFDLSPGDYVEITNGAETISYKYEGKGKAVKNGKERISNFWATHIPGDTAVIKLYSQNPGHMGYGFVIDKWVKGYERDLIHSLLNELDSPEEGGEAICTADDKEWAKCYSGTTMYDKSRAVCRLLINGNGACTGWLLGSEGHVMTNYHCIGSQSDASNTDFEFMAEGATCATDCSGWLDCPGTVAATSGTLVKNDYDLDYALVLLPTNVSGTYGYLQLRDTLPTVGERIYIPQHPGAKGKQLAVTSDVDGGYCEVYSTNQTPCMGGPGDIGYYGDTEGGSSGSPVIGYSDHAVVALHHCANCPNRGVPIPSIITDLGASLPNDAVAGSTPDTDPPVITSVASNDVSNSSARITWTTDEGATSIVHYGTTTAYGSTASVGGFVTAHSVTLTGLSANTTYHYKVVSADSSTNSAESGDYTFTTTNTPPPTEIYVYNIYMQKYSWWFLYGAEATITIRDSSNNVVPNATVYVTWSGKASGSESATTNASGQVTFDTGYKIGDGTFTITVTNVTHATYTYNSALNVETSDSI